MTLPSRRPSIARRLVAALVAVPLIMATVVLGRLIAITAPIGDDHRRPWIHQGQMNEPVVEHDIEVVVLSVRGGRAYEDFSDVPSTDGIFLLVRVRAMAFDTPSALNYAELIDHSGYAYDAIRHSDGLYQFGLLPRIPVEGELLFEVPAHVATQLRLRLSSTRGYWGQWQVMVEVPLEIDVEDVDDWSDDAAPLTVKEPEVVG
jgi:hypothetical protein